MEACKNDIIYSIYFCFRMSENASPARFVENEDPFLTDSNFKADINRKMRVPNKISMNDYENELSNGINSNWSPNYSNMQVPERILVAGQDQHIGNILANITKLKIITLFCFKIRYPSTTSGNCT